MYDVWNFYLSMNMTFKALLLKSVTPLVTTLDALIFIPKNLNSCTISIMSLLYVKRQFCNIFPLLLNTIIFVLSVLTTNFRFWQYSNSLSKHFGSPSFVCNTSTRSSAYIITLVLNDSNIPGPHDSYNISDRSLIYKLNNSGLNIQPCLTSLLDFTGSVRP